ncbi:MAG TPA: DUF4347 domain-containing protein, partial [Gammaproteobacteria bacterium]|nr:DUF4347 domain-containing protein [Gammaproteobacteria bacterium]
MEQLEPRMLLSAGVAGIVLPVDGGDFNTPDTLPELSVLATAPPDPGQAAVRELVIVDPHTPDYQVLIDSLQDLPGRSIEVVVLDAGSDGIEQVNRALSGYQSLSAVHIISHGSDGRIQLGNTWLDNVSLQAHKNTIAAWGDAMAGGGDLLFYGCDLASGSEGQQLLQALQTLTGADIAASDDLTGSAALGGDWNLEFNAGRVETAIITDGKSADGWVATLSSAPTVISNTGSTVLEGGTDSISTSELQYTSSHGSSDIVYSLTTAPAFGQLELTTDPGVAVSSFSQLDIDNNRLVYVHDGSSSSTTDSMVFDVRRLSGGGVNFNEVFTFTVTPVNDAPVINNQSFAVNENSGNGTSVGVVSATDEDPGDVLTYSITAGNTGNAFAIDSATGEITVSDATQLDFETNPAYSLTVQVQDNGTGTLTDTATVTVNLTDLNEAPAINNQSFAVNENTANGTVVGMVSASDPDTADTLTYSITAGNTGNAFAIDSATGEITVSDATQLDFETNPAYSLTVQVQDNGTGTLTDTATVTVNLADLNEAPVISNQSFGVAENSANG